MHVPLHAPAHARQAKQQGSGVTCSWSTVHWPLVWQSGQVSGRTSVSVCRYEPEGTHNPRWLGPFDAQGAHFTTIRGD